jgi:hypothetical protein
MSRHATWRAGFVWVVVAACSSKDTSHPPGIIDDCSENCDKGYGSPSAGGGAPPPSSDAGNETDSGSNTVACGSDCVTDPNFGLSLCSRSLVCPGVVVDRTNPALVNCGYVDLTGQCSVADVECLCNGAFLCPISTAANCATLSGLLSQQVDVCGPAIASNTCRALNTTPTRDGGRCDPDCLRACGNTPVCIGLCC